MTPISIVADMLVHALRTHRDGDALAVVFAITARVVEELPGDHSTVINWIDSTIPHLKGIKPSPHPTCTSIAAPSSSRTSAAEETVGSPSA